MEGVLTVLCAAAAAIKVFLNDGDEEADFLVQVGVTVVGDCCARKHAKQSVCCILLHRTTAVSSTYCLTPLQCVPFLV